MKLTAHLAWKANRNPEPLNRSFPNASAIVELDRSEHLWGNELTSVDSNNTNPKSIKNYFDVMVITLRLRYYNPTHLRSLTKNNYSVLYEKLN